MLGYINGLTYSCSAHHGCTETSFTFGPGVCLIDLLVIWVSSSEVLLEETVWLAIFDFADL